MSNKENPLLTIREFAEVAGVSRQNIYNQLEGRLSPYVIEIDNIKMIKKTALKYYPNALEQVDSKVDSKVEQPKKSGYITENILETLNKQLEIKDKQITELNKTIESMTNLMNQQQVLLSQQQQLSLIDKKQQEEIKEEPQEQQEEIKNKSFWASLFGKQ